MPPPPLTIPPRDLLPIQKPTGSTTFSPRPSQIHLSNPPLTTSLVYRAAQIAAANHHSPTSCPSKHGQGHTHRSSVPTQAAPPPLSSQRSPVLPSSPAGSPVHASVRIGVATRAANRSTSPSFHTPQLRDAPTPLFIAEPVDDPRHPCSRSIRAMASLSFARTSASMRSSPALRHGPVPAFLPRAVPRAPDLPNFAGAPQCPLDPLLHRRHGSREPRSPCHVASPGHTDRPDPCLRRLARSGRIPPAGPCPRSPMPSPETTGKRQRQARLQAAPAPLLLCFSVEQRAPRPYPPRFAHLGPASAKPACLSSSPTGQAHGEQRPPVPRCVLFCYAAPFSFGP
ncbi:hypothetical protein VPH35_085468 [Triticum aestivum]